MHSKGARSRYQNQSHGPVSPQVRLTQHHTHNAVHRRRHAHHLLQCCRRACLALSSVVSGGGGGGGAPVVWPAAGAGYGRGRHTWYRACPGAAAAAAVGNRCPGGPTPGHCGEAVTGQQRKPSVSGRAVGPYLPPRWPSLLVDLLCLS